MRVDFRTKKQEPRDKNQEARGKRQESRTKRREARSARSKGRAKKLRIKAFTKISGFKACPEYWGTKIWVWER